MRRTIMTAIIACLPLALAACDRSPKPAADRGINQEQARDRREAALETAVARADMKARTFEDRFDRLDGEFRRLDAQVGQLRKESVSRAEMSAALKRFRASLPEPDNDTAAAAPTRRR